MKKYRHALPLALAIAFGLLTLLGLLFVPDLAATMTGWASFLAAVALLIGVINLLGVHARRLAGGNAYSGVLIVSMVAVFIFALTDFLGLTEDGVNTIFQLIQVPLEAAVASLLVFFLLFAGMRLLRRQLNVWSVLFMATVLLTLLGRTLLPGPLAEPFRWINRILSEIVVTAGVRGILIGVAIGIVAVSLRILTGSERPYDK
jgi:hypothetical protein